MVMNWLDGWLDGWLLCQMIENWGNMDMGVQRDDSRHYGYYRHLMIRTITLEINRLDIVCEEQ